MKLVSIVLTAALVCGCQVYPKGYDTKTTYGMHDNWHYPYYGRKMIYRLDCKYCMQEKALDGSSSNH